MLLDLMISMRKIESKQSRPVTFKLSSLAKSDKGHWIIKLDCRTVPVGSCLHHHHRHDDHHHDHHHSDRDGDHHRHPYYEWSGANCQLGGSCPQLKSTITVFIIITIITIIIIIIIILIIIIIIIIIASLHHCHDGDRDGLPLLTILIM